MAVFWLGVYIFVNLTSILWLGATAVHTVTGIEVQWALLALGLFAGAYALYGGLKAVALTDVVQVSLLTLGGLVISYIALNRISGGAGVVAGFQILTAHYPQKFHMILPPSNPNYKDMPGLSVLIGGMWVMNLSYWGFNQYIIQRALAAKSTHEAQKGIVLAAFLKLLMPVIIVLPCIAAVDLAPHLSRPDAAYPSLMRLLPPGLLGLVFAALVAAIVASLGSKINSIATIFTMDLYRSLWPAASQRRLVLVGRCAAAAALIIALLVAKPLLGNFDQAFQYIQEFTGFFTPGICAIFLLGMFWPRTTAAAALAAAVASAVLSTAFKLLWPALPFMDRVGVVFLLCVGIAVLISMLQAKRTTALNVQLTGIDYRTTAGFNVGALAVILILVALYATWW
jgi:SSS family solute:Na+ symporter